MNRFRNARHNLAAIGEPLPNKDRGRSRRWAPGMVGVMTAVLMLGTLPLIAHHSFVMFDTSQRLTITGTVTDFQWTNPHAYIEIDATSGGAVKHWSIELGSPSILMQGGWKFSTLKHGDEVTVEINPLRNGDPGGLLIQAQVPDGRTLGNGPGRGPQGGKGKGKAARGKGK